MVRKTKWKVVHGTFSLPGRGSQRYGPGETFDAFESDVPAAFRDSVVPVGGAPVPDDAEAPQPTETDTITTFSVEHVGGGWYNVVDGSGKAVNETSLRQDAAKALVEELMGEGE